MQKMLVVVDPTAGGTQPAVDKAMRIAGSCGAALELYICDVEQDLAESWTGPSLAGEYREIRRQQLLAELDAMAAPARAGGLQVAICCEWHAPLEEGIGHHVIRTRPDLVVKGTLRSPAAARAGLNRTDWTLIRQIPAALLLVGPLPWRARLHVAAAVDPLHTADHPPQLDATLTEAGDELAALLGGQLELYHVLQNPPHLPGDTVSPQQKEDAHACASQAARRLAGRFSAKAVRTTSGRVVEGLARLVAEHAPDVLVMGAVARPRWVHSVASGTAAQILGRIACDLLVVKPPGFVSPLLVTED